MKEPVGGGVAEPPDVTWARRGRSWSARKVDSRGIWGGAWDTGGDFGGSSRRDWVSLRIKPPDFFCWGAGRIGSAIIAASCLVRREPSFCFGSGSEGKAAPPSMSSHSLSKARSVLRNSRRESSAPSKKRAEGCAL